GKEPADLTGPGGASLASKVSLALKFQFSKETPAPKGFNTADKAAEGVQNSIIKALIAACESVLGVDPQAPSYDWARDEQGSLIMDQTKIRRRQNNHHADERAYSQIWKPNAAAAYESAIAIVESDAKYLSVGE